MLAFTLSIAFAWLIGCASDAPVEPSDGCTELDLSPLASQWQETKAQRGHRLQVDLVITTTDIPCIFDYHYQVHVLEHEGQPEIERVYESYGDMVVVDSRFELGILNMAIESRRFYRWALDAQGNPLKNTELVVLERAQAKLWGSRLLLWGDQFGRVD